MQQLDLSYNKIKEIPYFIGELVSLLHLYIGKNEISYISEGIGNLIKLEILYLDEKNNHLLEDNLDYLINLKYILPINTDGIGKDMVSRKDDHLLKLKEKFLIKL